MVDFGDYIKAYARDVALDPPIAGHANVQDAIAAGGGVVLGNFSTDLVVQDTPTALTGDGNPHDVTCLIAAPPAWMDNAGHIIAPGLYNTLVTITATAGPTTPGLYVNSGGIFNAAVWVPCDALGASKNATIVDVQALAAGDLPYPVVTSVLMPTDVTEAVHVLISVDRLAH